MYLHAIRYRFLRFVHRHVCTGISLVFLPGVCAAGTPYYILPVFSFGFPACSMCLQTNSPVSNLRSPQFTLTHWQFRCCFDQRDDQLETAIGDELGFHIRNVQLYIRGVIECAWLVSEYPNSPQHRIRLCSDFRH